MRKTVAVSTSSFGGFDSKPLDRLAAAGFEVRLNPHGRKLTSDELVELVGDSQGLVAGTEPITAAALEALPALRVISRCGVGVDNVDREACARLGKKLFNTPDAPVDAVAELALGLVLSLLRMTHVMDRDIRAGTWKKRMGSLLRGQRAGVVGFGRIGQRSGELMRCLGANIVYADLEEKEAGYAAERMQLDDLLREVDVLLVHVPGGDDSRGLLDAERLSLLKPTSVLVNLSRGGVVDEAALANALAGGRLAGAALDVFEHEPYSGELAELPNVILTPHVGSYAVQSRVQMEAEAVENLLVGLGLT